VVNKDLQEICHQHYFADPLVNLPLLSPQLLPWQFPPFGGTGGNGCSICSPAAEPYKFILLFCDQISKQKSLFQGEVLPTPASVGTGQRSPEFQFILIPEV
jgi:hypothetical protein